MDCANETRTRTGCPLSFIALGVSDLLTPKTALDPGRVKEHSALFRRIRPRGLLDPPWVTDGGRRLPGPGRSKEALGHTPPKRAVSFHGSCESGKFLRPRFGSLAVMPSYYTRLTIKNIGIDPFREGGGRPSLGWANGTHGSLPRDLVVSSMAQSVAKGASPTRI
ncbi:hypothetical protein CRG98_015097 [Punica granatum]|uniref:Uncharacterized protein n=1 Tax=Punica granatum TaxID=22663 RepID=A0A2I0K7L0_PUNGR|nr:hypothetical protein CRG98_015097 [Punica granatum]